MVGQGFQVDHLLAGGCQGLEEFGLPAAGTPTQDPQGHGCCQLLPYPGPVGLVPALEDVYPVPGQFQHPGHDTRAHAAPPAIQRNFAVFGQFPDLFDKAREGRPHQLKPQQNSRVPALLLIGGAYGSPVFVVEQREVDRPGNVGLPVLRG